MGKILQVSLAFSAGLGTLLHGYNSGVISHILTNSHFTTYFSTATNPTLTGALVSVFAAGASLGSLASAFLLDRHGRKKTIQIGAVISILGVILQAAAVRLSMMLLGRIITGFAVGMMGVGVPLYLSEQSLARSRGFWVCWVQLMILLGFVIAAWAGYAAHNVPNAAQNPFTWRFPLAIAAIPAVFIAFAMQWLPESPRFLVMRGELDRAFRGMMQVHGDGENRKDVQKMLEDMEIQWRQETLRWRGGDWEAMWKVREWRRRTVNAMLPSVLTQLTGINLLTYYQSTVFEKLGVSDTKALLLNAAYHMVGPLGTLLLMIFVIDRFGRRIPLLVGTLVLPLLFVAFIVLSTRAHSNKSAATGSISVIFVFNVVFCFSFGPIGWVYLPEMLPLRIRGKAAALGAGVGNWMVNVVISQITPKALVIGWKYYLIFVLIGVFVTAPSVWFLVKETKGLSLEQVDVLWPMDDGKRGSQVEMGEGSGSGARKRTVYGETRPVEIDGGRKKSLSFSSVEDCKDFKEQFPASPTGSWR